MINQANNILDIAIFTPSLEGGIGRFVVNLSREFIDQGYSLEIVTIKMGSNDIPHEGISIINFDTRRAINSLFKLVSYLKKRQPRVLLSALFHANLIAIFAKLLSLSTSPVVATEHVALKEELKRLSLIKRSLFKLLIRFFYPMAKKITAGSKGVRDDLLYFGVPSKKIEVIYYPIINKDLFLSAEGEVDEQWLKETSVPIVLAVGRLTKQKDFQTLIETFALVIKESLAKLIIIGDGYEKINLITLIAKLGLNERVFLLGHKQNHYPYYKKANLFVLSSRYEGLGIVLVEALALGTPVVSTDCQSGPREVLKGGELGALVPVGDKKALAQAIINTLNNPGPKAQTDQLAEFVSVNSADHYKRILF